MRRQCLLVCLLGACLLALVSADQCVNSFAAMQPISLPATEQGAAPITVRILTSSVANSGKICGDVPQMCCDPTDLSAFAQQVNTGISAMTLGASKAHEAVDKASQQIDSIPLPDEQKSAIKKIIGRAPEMIDASKDCALALATYVEGMVCLACRPTAGTYFDLAKMELNLAINTCDQVAGMCSRPLMILNDIKKDVLSLLDAFHEQVPTAARLILSSSENICENIDPSDHDCRHLLCDHLGGADMPNISGLLPPMGGGGGGSGSGGFPTLGPFSHVNVLASLSANPQALVGRLSDFILDAAPKSNASKAVYTSNGYDAYEAGCSSGMTTEPCPRPPSKLSTTALVLIIAGSSLAFLLVVFLCCRYRKKRAEAQAASLPYAQEPSAANPQPYQPYRQL